MQIFVLGNPMETAINLDNRRFHNQITEARIILNCIDGKNGWDKHPLSKMYWDHRDWLELYIKTLKCYRDNLYDLAREYSRESEKVKPRWMNEWFYNIHKSRLYTKNKSFYNKYSYLGECYSNWYRVNGVWKEYPQK